MRFFWLAFRLLKPYLGKTKFANVFRTMFVPVAPNLVLNDFFATNFALPFISGLSTRPPDPY
jgi:hypothetical protein